MYWNSLYKVIKFLPRTHLALSHLKMPGAEDVSRGNEMQIAENEPYNHYNSTEDFKPLAEEVSYWRAKSSIFGCQGLKNN